MTEAEGPSAPGGADEVRGHEAIEQNQRVTRRQTAGLGRQLRVEAVTGHGRAVQQHAGRPWQRAHLELHRSQQSGRQLVTGLAGGPSELLQEERVAPGVAHHPLAQVGVGEIVDQFQRRLSVERLELQVGPRRGGAGGVEQPRSRIERPQREGEQMG